MESKIIDLSHLIHDKIPTWECESHFELNSNEF